MQIFERLESNVRSYCRSFPTVFTRSQGYKMWDEAGREYIDFFAGAGTLNYGHNNPRLKEKLVEYINRDGITHSLDMFTTAKANFLARFEELILKPRRMQYKVMFPGPTGTNSVESALKLARKVNRRETIVSFTNAFHGMTLGALAITGNAFKRRGAGVPLHHSVQMPYDHYMGDQQDSLLYLERYLQDNGSGLDLPAAIIVETVQGEGGLKKASFRWLKRLAELCRTWEILLIVDDIQAGCGRTGSFFSFEPAGIEPDIICLSKSLSGYGLPMAVTLIKPEHDIWAPGEHNGTFRGHNLAFVTAAKALVEYWQTDELCRETDRKARKVRRMLSALVAEHPEIQGELRGRGLIQGIACGVDGLADKVCAAAFERGLVMETSGPDSEVIKLLPPLIIDDAGLDRGLQILAESVAECARQIRAAVPVAVR